MAVKHIRPYIGVRCWARTSPLEDVDTVISASHSQLVLYIVQPSHCQEDWGSWNMQLLHREGGGGGRDGGREGGMEK